MTRIDKPGIYADYPEAQYFADPCPRPSLTQSIAKLLLEASPRHAYHAHPRLNIALTYDDEKKFDLAHAAHALLLGKGREISVADEWPNWRTKASQQFRASVVGRGGIPLLRPMYEQALQMLEACQGQMRDAHMHFSDAGMSECMVAWTQGQTWCRGKLDRLELGLGIIFDYKTTAGSAAPGALQYKSAEESWDIQSAMYSAGVLACKPELAGRLTHVRIVQETAAPYACNISILDEATLTVGRQKFEAALQIWNQCLMSKRWPSYNDGNVGIVTIGERGLQNWSARYLDMVNPTTKEVRP